MYTGLNVFSSKFQNALIKQHAGAQLINALFGPNLLANLWCIYCT